MDALWEKVNNIFLKNLADFHSLCIFRQYKTFLSECALWYIDIFTLQLFHFDFLWYFKYLFNLNGGMYMEIYYFNWTLLFDLWDIVEVKPLKIFLRTDHSTFKLGGGLCFFFLSARNCFTRSINQIILFLGHDNLVIFSKLSQYFSMKTRFRLFIFCIFHDNLLIF